MFCEAPPESSLANVALSRALSLSPLCFDIVITISGKKCLSIVLPCMKAVLRRADVQDLCVESWEAESQLGD